MRDPSPAAVEAVKNELRRRYGLAGHAMDGGVVARVLNRLADCAGGAPEDSAVEALARDECRRALIEAFTVPETWFFRDIGAYEYLGRHAREHWIRPGAAPVRILSAACSTGEEPYSAAMVLLDAGLGPDRFSIDAFDLNPASIAKAREAVYGPNSFRGVDEAVRRRFFEPVPGGLRVREPARGTVRFAEGNALAPDAPFGWRPYHAVFCKNVMIYLAPEYARSLLDRIEKWVAPGGLLFVGSAETMQLASRPFRPVNHRGAFAFVKRDSSFDRRLEKSSRRIGEKRTRLDKPQSPPPWKKVPPPAPEPDRRAMPGPGPAGGREGSSLAERGRELERARELADRGKLGEAYEICERLRREGDPSAALYFLMGLIEESRGRGGEAEDCYNRALYLDPRHYETLIHLAYLLESRGSGHRAAVFRERAERVRAREGVGGG